MLIHTAEFAVIAAAFLVSLVMLLLDALSSLEFARKHFPSVVRFSMKRKWQLLFILLGLGMLSHEITYMRSTCPVASMEVSTPTPTAKSAPAQKTARPTSTKAKAALPSLAKRWKQLDSEMLSFQGEMNRTTPTVILSSTSPDLTEKSMQAAAEHDRQAVITFLGRFSIPLADVIRIGKHKGLDVSGLEGHIQALNSIPMMSLVAGDVGSLSRQLEMMGSGTMSTN